MEQVGPHCTDYHEIRYLNIFTKFVQKIHVSLKFDKNIRYFTWRTIYIHDHISLNSCYNEKCYTQKLYTKIKIHNLSSETFPRKSCRFQIMWKNILQPDRPQMATWPMRISRWTPKTTNTHMLYILLFHSNSCCLNASHCQGICK